MYFRAVPVLKSVLINLFTGEANGKSGGGPQSPGRQNDKEHQVIGWDPAAQCFGSKIFVTEIDQFFLPFSLSPSFLSLLFWM